MCSKMRHILSEVHKKLNKKAVFTKYENYLFFCVKKGYNLPEGL